MFLSTMIISLFRKIILSHFAQFNVAILYTKTCHENQVYSHCCVPFDLNTRYTVKMKRGLTTRIVGTFS